MSTKLKKHTSMSKHKKFAIKRYKETVGYLSNNAIKQWLFFGTFFHPWDPEGRVGC